MRRRQVLPSVAGLALAVPAWHGSAWPQPAARAMRVGWLRPNGPAPADVQATGIPAALKRLGWVEGHNLILERRWADGNVKRLPAMAAELVQARCDAVISVGTAASIAMAQASRQTPVVMFGNFDPVARGLVPQLARPGGNLTGVLIAPDGSLAAKRLEVLKEVAPRAGRIALLAPDDPTFDAQVAETRTAATAMAIELPVVMVRDRDHRRAFADIAASGARAVVIGAHTYFMSPRHELISLAASARLPTSWEWAEQVRDGGLLSYGTSLAALYDRVAALLDRILRGTPPGDLPVERATTFGLTINLRTARAIGLPVPRPLLLRAHEVIE